MSVPPAVGFYCDSPTARGGETGKGKKWHENRVPLL